VKRFTKDSGRAGGSIMRKITLSIKALLFLTTILLGTYDVSVGEQKWDTVTAEALKQKIDAGEDLCLINVLPRIVFNSGHIEGSINIPIGKIETSNDFPEDKDKPLVFYCMGVA
jgi:hypothetical protein